MPELPEVETVRRMLDATVIGRTIRTVRLSGQKLREPIPRDLPRRLAGLRFQAARRHGKYLLLDLDRGFTLLSHLGMSGRWLFHPEGPVSDVAHVHVRIRFVDGSELWFADPRRFGLFRLVPTARLDRDRSLAELGPDPVAQPPTGTTLGAIARGSRVSIKVFLLDQRRLAGIGNIYASEILHRAAVDPRIPACRVPADRWEAIAAETQAVLVEAIERSGTTFSMYRTIWNEPGQYGEQLRVYDRAGEPCLVCDTEIRRIVQGARSTFFCPSCQPTRRKQPLKRPLPRGSGAPPRPARKPPSRPRRAVSGASRARSRRP